MLFVPTMQVRDEQGRKMSKTLGNVLDPLDVIAKYGADALRFTLATGSRLCTHVWPKHMLQACLFLYHARSLVCVDGGWSSCEGAILL